MLASLLIQNRDRVTGLEVIGIDGFDQLTSLNSLGALADGANHLYATDFLAIVPDVPIGFVNILEGPECKIPNSVHRMAREISLKCRKSCGIACHTQHFDGSLNGGPIGRFLLQQFDEPLFASHRGYKQHGSQCFLGYQAI